VRERDGFTLLEVALAVFVLAVAMGGVISAVTQNLSALADARAELEALEHADERMRVLMAEGEAGILPEFGVSGGEFEDPNSGLAWELRVAPVHLPLPPGFEPGPELPSSLFQSWDVAPGGVEPSLRHLALWVYPLGEQPGELPHFEALLAAPPAPPDAGDGAASSPSPETER
jgi:prepilin-type N-terminal cleavage/methylation domain-containing protein